MGIFEINIFQSYLSERVISQLSQAKSTKQKEKQLNPQQLRIKPTYKFNPNREIIHGNHSIRAKITINLK